MILLVLQFLACIGMIFTGPVLSKYTLLILVQILGLMLGIWAIITLRRFNMHPTIKGGASLTTTGPYHTIRNPMYTALLMVFTPPVLLDGLLSLTIPDMRRVACLGLLMVVLGLKIRVEEKLLRERFPDYTDYAAKTKRLIPWIL